MSSPQPSVRTRIALFTRSLRYSRKLWFKRAAFWGGGLMVGLTAVVMALGAAWAQRMFAQVEAVSLWLPLIVTPAGFALSAFLTRRYFAGAQGSGIPQAIVAHETDDEALRDRLLSLRVAIGKIGLTILGILCGGSVGREGPTVQVGAAIMNSVGRFWGRQQQALIVAGGAAGVAAAFNTPLGGIVFAIEEMSRSLERGVNGLMLGAVIIAGIAALGLTGNYTYFGRVVFVGWTNAQWMVVPICGVICGVGGGVFSLLATRIAGGHIPRLNDLMRNRPVIFAAACGLFVALVGVASAGATFGTGYEPAKHLLENQGGVMPGYGLLKFLATAASSVSGIPGGIFSPSLSVGAGLGADIARFMPNVPTSTVVLMAMVAYFAGVVQAPITAFVIVAEMTGSYELTAPLMAASWIGYATAKLIGARPIYDALAESMRSPNSAPAPR